MNLNALRSRQLTSHHSWKLMTDLLTVSTTPSYLRPRTILSHSVNFRHQRSPVPPVSSLITMSCTTTNMGSNLVDTLMNQKKIIRSKIKRDLKSMDSNLRSQEDEAIQRNVLEAPWFKSCKRLCAYISCNALREVDTSEILSRVLSNSSKDGDPQIAKKLYVPRVEDKNCHMRMLNISSINDLIANSMNILEPTSTDIEGHEREDVMLSTHPVELLLLPGLAFDRHGNRLGRGGGYYDAFLAKYKELAEKKTWKQPLLVALSYSLQIMDDDVIPVTPNDVLVDALVSPNGVIPISPAAHAWYTS